MNLTIPKLRVWASVEILSGGYHLLPALINQLYRIGGQPFFFDALIMAGNEAA